MSALGKLARFAVKAARTELPAVMPAAERAANAQRFVAKSVVREGGKPVRVFTGTSKDVDFNKVKVPRNGTWFTTDPEAASGYALENDSMGFTPDHQAKKAWAMKAVNSASRVMPAFLNIEQPKIYLDPKEMADEVYRLGGENYKRGQGLLFDQLRSQGHDGVQVGDGTFVVLGGPHQIKSASGNTGAFDPAQPRMDKARGGLAVKRRRK